MVFYGIDSRRVTLAEYRWGTPLALMPLVLLLKLLRVKLPSSTDDANVASLAAFEVAPSELSPEDRDRLQPMVAGLSRLGFVEPIAHRIVDPLHSTRIVATTLRHHSGIAVARAHSRVWSHTHPAKERSFPLLLTGLSDGGFLLSTAGKPDLAAPPTCLVNRVVDAAPEALWRSHRDALLRLVPDREALLVSSADETRALLERHHAAVRDFHLARGVFSPLAAEQKARQAAELAGRAATTTRFPEELQEIARLQSGKTSWGAALATLLVTIALFVGLGAAAWSLEWTLLLLPILLLHEAGHYVAMRMFHYRNVRMFFLPLFGAAVVGRSQGAPGWKRALVAMAGPLPGIAVGLGLGAAALLLEGPGLARAGLMMLALNGFNLLPFLPLDGGWILQAVLFSRHYLLDVAFRCLAVLGMLAIAVLIGDKILGYLAIPMAIGVLPAWRNGRIAHELRRAGVSAQPSPDGSLPVPVLETIIERLRSQGAKSQTRRLIAQSTLDIAETLSAQPPGGLVTLGLLALYAAAIAVAALGGLLLAALR